MSVRFADDLLAAARERDIDANPFVRGVRSGAYTRAGLRWYAMRIFALTRDFPGLLASVIARCDDRRVRLHLLHNLLEEEGVVSFSAETGIRQDAERPHAELARRFATAVRASASDLERAAAPGSRWLERAGRRGDWIALLSYLSVGYEANVPRTFRALIPGLRTNYALADGDLTFSMEHVSADERHGLDGARLVASAARGEAGRRSAIEGARRGASEWWLFHNACDRAMRNRRVES